MSINLTIISYGVRNVVALAEDRAGIMHGGGMCFVGSGPNTD